MMVSKPERIQLRRSKGWRMPENTVNVDHTTPWGNPFVVGQDGKAGECVRLYAICVLGSFVSLTSKCGTAAQDAARKHARENIAALKGKNLACWCTPGKPCHADYLLYAANGWELPESMKFEGPRPLEEVNVRESLEADTDIVAAARNALPALIAVAEAFDAYTKADHQHAKAEAYARGLAALAALEGAFEGVKL